MCDIKTTEVANPKTTVTTVVAEAFGKYCVSLGFFFSWEENKDLTFTALVMGY